MDGLSIHGLLTLVIWCGAALLLLLVALIARKYETLSGERTYYQGFAVPVLAWAGAAARLAHLDRVAGDALSDLLLAGGGVVLAGLCWHMVRRMTSGQ